MRWPALESAKWLTLEDNSLLIVSGARNLPGGIIAVDEVIDRLMPIWTRPRL